MAPPDRPVFLVTTGVFVETLGWVDCEPGGDEITDGELDVRQVASLDRSATIRSESPPTRPWESIMLNMADVPAGILASQANEFELEIGGWMINDRPDGMKAYRLG